MIHQSPRPQQILLACLTAGIAAFAALFAVEKVYNYDIWWHLATGRWILDNGAVPGVDIFSFSVQGQPWVPNAWLADLLLVLLHGAAGIDGLILFKALVIGCSFGLMHWAMRRAGVNPYLAAGILGLVVVIARFRFMLRPEIFAFLFAALFFIVLSSRRWSEGWRAFVLAPLMLLWINLHGSGLLAPVIAGCLAGERVLLWGYRRLRGREGDGFPLRLVLVVVALLALFLATPAGLNLPKWTLYYFGRTGVEEEAPLVWGSYKLFWALLLATGASFLGAARRARLFHLALYLVTVLLAFSHQRWVGLAAFLSAPVLGANLQLLLDRLRGRLELGWRWQAAAGLPALAIAGWLAFTYTFTEGKTYQFGLGVVERRFPTKAVQLLRKAGYSGNIFNSWELGGYLSWHLPAARTFIDGRCMRAQLELVARAEAMDQRQLGRYLEQHDVGAAVLRQRDGHARHFAASPAYKAALLDDASALYLREDWSARAAVRGFKYVRLDAFEPSYLLPLARGPDADAVEAELRRALRMTPDGFKAPFMLGFFLEARGRPEALTHYRAAARSSPGFAHAHFQLGTRAAKLAMRHGRWQEAVGFLQASMKYRATPEDHFILGTALYKAGRHAEAEAALKRAIELAPRLAAARTNLGFLYIDTKRWAEASAAFASARQHAPGHAPALYGLALALQRSGRADRAAPYWKELIAKHPGSPLAGRARRFLGGGGAP